MATYYSLTGIKNKLHIDDGDQDPYINDLGEQADSYINIQVGLHATTPLNVPDSELKALANKLAAAEYLLWNSPDHPRALYDSARKDIQSHIKAQYGGMNDDSFTSSTFSKTNSGIKGTES
jgi:hypothetical protein